MSLEPARPAFQGFSSLPPGPPPRQGLVVVVAVEEKRADRGLTLYFCTLIPLLFASFNLQLLLIVFAFGFSPVLTCLPSTNP